MGMKALGRDIGTHPTWTNSVKKRSDLNNTLRSTAFHFSELFSLSCSFVRLGGSHMRPEAWVTLEPPNPWGPDAMYPEPSLGLLCTPNPGSTIGWRNRPPSGSRMSREPGHLCAGRLIGSGGPWQQGLRGGFPPTWGVNTP